MNFDEILIQSEFLREKISTCPEIIAVEEAQKKMLDDFDVIRLISAFQTAQDHYNDALKFHLETQNDYIKEISITKAALYCHLLVMAYNEALKKANIMLDEVTALIFDDLIVDFKPSVDPLLFSHCVVEK